MSYEKKIDVRWSDIDQNRHVRHSAYYDYGAHTRIQFFTQFGYNTNFMQELNIGPILFKEECTFLKELHADEVITVNLLKGDISEDGSRWVLHHEIFNQKGDKSAHITIKGAWMDLKLRKLTTPPVKIVEIINQLPKGDYFEYKK